MLIKVLLFFCYCFSSKRILLSLAPFSLGQAIQINLVNKRKHSDSEKKNTKSDKKLIQSKKEKTHQCNVCDKTFSTKHNLSTHKKTQHKKKDDVPQEKTHKCDACPKSFDRIGKLTNHKRSHTGEKPFECHVCHTRFTQKSSLTEHKKQHDVLAKSDKKIQSNKNQPFECHICHTKFTQNSSLTRHNNKYHNLKNHVPQDETQVRQESNSTRMEDRADESNDQIPTSPMELISEGDFNQSEKCLDLSYQGEFPPFDELTTSHIEIISEGNFNQSEECLDPSYQEELPPFDGNDQIPTSPMELISEGDFKKKADVLPKSDKQSIQSNKEKTHKCDVCNEKFARNQALLIHKRTHTGEKTYQCDDCPKRFSDPSNYKRHKQLCPNDKSDVPQEETQAGQESNSTRMEDISEFDLYNIEEDLYPSYQGELPPVDDSDQLTTSHMANTSELPLKNKESRKHKNEAWLYPSYQGELPPVDDSDNMITLSNILGREA